MNPILAATGLLLLCFAEGSSASTPNEPATKQGADSDAILRAFQRSCNRCHGKEGKAAGNINLFALKHGDDLVSQPELIQELIDALESGFMPPEEEPPLAEPHRQRLVVGLRRLLTTAVDSAGEFPSTPIRRMNRFQYSNAVQDLFQLNCVVFPLPERMLREHGTYFRPQSGKLPDKVKVGSRPLGKSQLIERRLGGVTPFPQDLRAEHGFDNRADHLSLSPLLLEAFLRLSRSIVESPDFHAKTCGIWNDFFAPPPSGVQIEVVVGKRLRRFLRRAFRRPVEPELLGRYADYVLGQLRESKDFTESMKSAAAAALASPRFFYLYDQGNGQGVDSARQRDFDLASRLSFFLWGSIPDDELLDLAAQGKLHQLQTLSGQVERMLADRKLKRFCDSFPVQWLQLEQIIASTPDPRRYPQFYFGKYRASMHMMLEPLLLFEAVLIENQSILQFLDSDFSYRSRLLQAWYRDDKQGRVGSPVILEFHRVPVTDRREGGMITNAAVMTMTSSPTRTKPITRGAWIASVILNDPPEPPPADVPPLNEHPEDQRQNLTLRERFSLHRKRADCAGCHRRIDPLGFALENYDAAGLWREHYQNGRRVDPSGRLFGKHEFTSIVEFKEALLAEKDRFTRAFASHLLSFALGRPMKATDSPALDQLVQHTAAADYRFQALLQAIVLSDPFRQPRIGNGQRQQSARSPAE